MAHVSRQLLKEQKLHGDKSFPLAVYWMDQQGGDIPIVDCHWHKEVEFFYCIEGEVLFQLNQDYINVKQGEVLFIDSEVIHTGHAVAHYPCKFAAIVLDAKLLDSAELDSIQTQYITPFHEQLKTFPQLIHGYTAWEKQLITYVKQIIKAYEQKQLGYELLIKAHLLLMLQLVHLNNGVTNRTTQIARLDSHTERLKTIITYIHKHYQKPISINVLAQLIPMSEGHFCRFFKKMTRQTVTEFINSYRLKQAAHLLLVTDMKIATIAYEVGFEHISYFTKLFKVHYKMSPSQYRKQK